VPLPAYASFRHAPPGGGVSGEVAKIGHQTSSRPRRQARSAKGRAPMTRQTQDAGTRSTGQKANPPPSSKDSTTSH